MATRKSLLQRIQDAVTGQKDDTASPSAGVEAKPAVTQESVLQADRPAQQPVTEVAAVAEDVSPTSEQALFEAQRRAAEEEEARSEEQRRILAEREAEFVAFQKQQSEARQRELAEREAELAERKAAAEEAARSHAAAVAAAQARSYVVQPGDSLSAIALEVYRDAGRWPEIFEANRDLLSDPNLINPGQKLRIP